jgi:ABC-type dipeptide/oligopeptide/nickel transport system permease subunit
MADTRPQDGPEDATAPRDSAASSPVPGAGGTVAQTEQSSVIEREFTVAARTQTQMVIRRFLQHRLAVASLVVFIVIVVGSLGGARLWKYNYADITKEFSTPPSLEHPFGTDDIGHDTFAQVLRGAQKSVQVALVVAVLATGFGAVLGAVAGYYRGVVDSILMRFTDLVLTIPLLAIAALLAGTIGGGDWFVVALVIASVSWMSIARVVRGTFLSLREKEFVDAARALGASDARIIFRHLLPNATGSIIVNATITVAVAILVETALTFLGLGIRPPDTSLGLLVSAGQQAAQTRPWLFYFPGLVIVVIALSINFIGDGLRDAFDPTQTRVRA